MQQKFQDVAEGSVFKHNGLDYKKVPLVKVSCCRSLNAEQVDNSNNKIFVQPSQEVEVNDQQ